MSEIDLHYFYAGAVSFVVCLLIYKVISPVLSSKLCPGYNKLEFIDQIDWNTRTVSSLHSMLVSSVCVYILFTDDKLAEDPCMYNAELVRWNCAVVSGYMTADLVIILSNYSIIGDVCYVFHHLATLAAYCAVVSFGQALGFANFRLMSEMSTPFVNLRWFLDTLCYSKTSPLFLLNAGALFVSFFLVRIVAAPPFWMIVYRVYGTPQYLNLSIVIKFVLFAVPFVLDVINFYWFSKIVRGAMKLVRAKSKELKGEHVTDFKLA